MCHGVCNREFGARLGRAASEVSAGCGSAPESGSFHPRTTPSRDAEDSYTNRRCLALCRPTGDRWTPKRLAAMGTQPEGPSDPAHRGLLNAVFAASTRLLQCVAPLGAASKVSRTARSTRSSPICRGAPGRASSPKAASPPVIKRFRHIPTVKPVVCSWRRPRHCSAHWQTPE